LTRCVAEATWSRRGAPFPSSVCGIGSREETQLSLFAYLGAGEAQGVPVTGLGKIAVLVFSCGRASWVWTLEFVFCWSHRQPREER